MPISLFLAALLWLSPGALCISYHLNFIPLVVMVGIRKELDIDTNPIVKKVTGRQCIKQPHRVSFYK